MKLRQHQGTELELAEIQLRVAARNYAEQADDPSDAGHARTRHHAAKLREAAENYAAVKVGLVPWKMSS